MKKLNCKIERISRLVFGLSLLLLLSSCNNVDEIIIVEEEEEGVTVFTDAWICDMQSFEEDFWHYELYLEDNGDYLAISDTRILKVSKNGILNSMILLTYPDDDYDVVRVFNNKIYRFHYENEFQMFDPAQPLKLQIYDFDFILISEHILDSNGLIYDVEIESDNLFGMLVYNPDENKMRLKKIDLTDGLVSEFVLSTTGTNPTNLHILETGDYFCTAGSSQNNLFLFDNDLNLTWQNEINSYTISDAKYISGQGIYITGRGTSFSSFAGLSYVALLDMDGNEINNIGYDADERRSPRIEINQERICLIQTEPESNKNMLFSILDYDLNIESTIEIPGNVVMSDVIVNENQSFSFVYGIAADLDDPDFFPLSNTRIFKFDASYTLPTNVIIQ